MFWGQGEGLNVGEEDRTGIKDHSSVFGSHEEVDRGVFNETESPGKKHM